MAMYETARPAPFGAITVYHWVSEPVMNVIDWIAERVETGRTARQLARLTPAMLDDIGLTEADVLSYQRKASFF